MDTIDKAVSIPILSHPIARARVPCGINGSIPHTLPVITSIDVDAYYFSLFFSTLFTRLPRLRSAWTFVIGQSGDKQIRGRFGGGEGGTRRSKTRESRESRMSANEPPLIG